MDPSIELHSKIDTLNESECKLFLSLIKKKQLIGLLQREAEWINTHHYVYECDKSSCCSNCYSGDTEFEFKHNLISLVVSLFDKEIQDTSDSEENTLLINETKELQLEGKKIDYDKISIIDME